MKDHLDEFNKLILDLKNVNIVLKNEDKILILLSLLLDSYKHFCGYFAVWKTIPHFEECEKCIGI